MARAEVLPCSLSEESFRLRSEPGALNQDGPLLVFRLVIRMRWPYLTKTGKERCNPPCTRGGTYSGNRTVVKWENGAWVNAIPNLSPGSGSPIPIVLALSPFDADGIGLRPPTLYIGGSIRLTAPSNLSDILNWGFQGATGDYNHDGQTNGKDISTFVDGVLMKSFVSGDLSDGDFNLDGSIDINDLQDFADKLARK